MLCYCSVGLVMELYWDLWVVRIQISSRIVATESYDMVSRAFAHLNAFQLVCHLQYPSLQGHDFIRPTWNGGKVMYWCGFCTRNSGIRYSGGFVVGHKMPVRPLLAGDGFKVCLIASPSIYPAYHTSSNFLLGEIQGFHMFIFLLSI